MRIAELARRGARTRTFSAPCPRRMFATTAAAVGVLALLAPPADARWTRVSSSPSSTSPYFVCPGEAHRARCEVIQDPTRGSQERGPVPAGAITTGPEQEVSPAFSGSGVEGGYSPGDLRSAYNLPSASAGSGQTVAVVDAYDDPKAEADLSAYRHEYELSECTSSDGCFEKVDQAGGSTPPPANRTWAREIALDLDMVSAICPSCHILLVEANTAESTNLAVAENEAVGLGATEISDSFAESESPEFAAAYDHPGIPIAAAGGDGGYGVVSPASFPSVIAVGGTTLRPAARRRGWSETVWDDEGGGELSGTGSGCSREPKPAWQTDSGCLHRTTNDVAAVADPNTPVSVYDSNEAGSPWLLMGGTSVSAPIVAGAMALSTPYTRSFDGAHALYLESANGGGFNDIVSGINGHCGDYLCEAGFGYDGPSGLGSLNGAPEVLPPDPVTGAAVSITQAEATLDATVNPHGADVDECRFEYGPTSSYGSSTACTSLPGPATSPVAVSAPVAGLVAGTLYHFRIAVNYPGGSAHGGDQTFTTLGNPPAAWTAAASSVTQSSASLNAQVDPGGIPVSGCEFEYGSSTSYGASTPCTPPPGSGQAPVAVSALLGGLAAKSTYHYRVVASNANGTSYGGDRTVTLLPELPSVVTDSPSALTPSSATLNATVNPNGGTLTSCEFEFNSAEADVPCATTPGSQESPQAVSAPVYDLRSGATFRYRIVAGNASGLSYGGIEEFSTPPSPALEPAVPQPAAVQPVPPEDPPAYEAELTGRTLIVSSRGELSVRVRCPPGATHCEGLVKLQTIGALSAAGDPRTRRILTLASGSFTARRAGAVAVRMHLSAHALALLAQSTVLRARATVLTRAPSGPAHVWQTVVRLRAAAGGHTSSN